MGMDKILRIDMGAEGGPKATTEPLGDYAGLGGRAMTSIVVSAEVDPLCHPLSAANKLVFAPGMLTGSAASTTTCSHSRLTPGNLPPPHCCLLLTDLAAAPGALLRSSHGIRR